MTYPPPGGENPQYHLQPEPLPPSDPYAQGYNSTPPPPGNHYQQQPPPYTQPMMSPQVGVQPGYPSAPGSVLPPPIPPAKQGGSLGVILGVIVALVVVLGIAAVLIIPGMINDENPSAGGGVETSEKASPEETESAPEPTEEAPTTADAADDEFATWGPAVNSEDFDPNTPEGAAITYMMSADSGDDAALQAVVCSSPTGDMTWDMEYELRGDGEQFGWLFWGVSREVDGETQAWSGRTSSDTAPDSQDDLDSISSYYFTVVEEEGQWKVCDIWQG